MKVLLADPRSAANALADRRKSGLDLYDEVWEGTYILMPLPGNPHQRIVNRLAADLTGCVEDRGLGEVFPGANVSDDPDDWTKNYRCPDVLAFLNGNPAEDRGSHWLGGPDLAVEVLSEGDLTLEKLPFYASVGVRELWILDRDPWRLTRHTLTGGVLKPDGATEPGGPPVRSGLLPLDWTLTAGEAPAVRVAAA